MKIAQVAPLYESVPPKYYGGTERVVSYLTEELIRMGHDVTLFASGDSVTQARLEPICPRSLRLHKTCIDQLAHHIVMLERITKRLDEFDLVHYHIDYLHFPLSRRSQTPHVTTLHGRLDIPDLVPLYREFAEMPVVSISDSQREPLPWLNWQETVYHGIPENLYTFHERPGRYLAFLGRISPEKGVHRAIRIATRVGMKIKIAAKADPLDRSYFEKVKPLMEHPLVDYVGEIGEKGKSEFLGNAYALLFPIDWPEPFGMVMIEAMACGTPVIAFRNGSVPEIVEPGATGFIVGRIDQAVRAIKKAGELDRRRIREAFNKRFASARMARDYVNLYNRLLKGKSNERHHRHETRNGKRRGPAARPVLHLGDVVVSR